MFPLLNACSRRTSFRHRCRVKHAFLFRRFLQEWWDKRLLCFLVDELSKRPRFSLPLVGYRSRYGGAYHNVDWSRCFCIPMICADQCNWNRAFLYPEILCVLSVRQFLHILTACDLPLGNKHIFGSFSGLFGTRGLVSGMTVSLLI